MKRGTASRAFFGVDKTNEDFGGLLLLSQVTLGKKSGMFDEHKGLCIVDNVLLGKGIARVISVIIRGTSPLSLPDAIADSLSYVKAFGGTKQQNLPDGYIERQFIYMMDGSYLLTDIVPTYDGHYEMDFQTTSVPASDYSVYLLGGRTQTYGGLFFAKAGGGVCIVDAFGTSSGDRYTSSVSLSSNTRYKFTFDNKVATFESGGTTLFTNTFTGENANGAALVINGLNSSGTVSGAQAGIYLYSFKAWNAQGELVADYVPAVQKGTVPVVGFYDTVSKTFKTATAGTFAAGGEAVPTPDTPMDIVSNNGVLKARHQSGLPLGYTLLDYVSFDGTAGTGAYVDTGIEFYNQIPNNKIRIKAKTKVYNKSSWQVICGNLGSVSAYTGVSPENKIAYGLGSTDAITNVLNQEVLCVFDLDLVSGTYKVTNTSTGVDIVNITGIVPVASTNVRNILLGGYDNAAGTITNNRAKMDFESAEIYNDGVLVSKLIPCKNSSNVVGCYDVVRDVFLTNVVGSTNFVAGNTVSDPVEIYTDGTVETIEDIIGNTATAEMLLKLGDYQDVQEILSGGVTRNIGIKILDGTEDWAKGTLSFYVNDIIPNIKPKLEDYTPYCSHYKGYPNSNENPPFNDAIKLGFNTSVFVQRVSIYDNRISTLTLEQFKQWLADQYAAGTPVIIIYPLATPTAESVAGQTLQVQAGDNTLEITQASLSNLELEVQYQAAVSLTIQEVQDANLDPNVEVTIN